MSQSLFYCDVEYIFHKVICHIVVAWPKLHAYSASVIQLINQIPSQLLINPILCKHILSLTVQSTNNQDVLALYYYFL